MIKKMVKDVMVDYKTRKIVVSEDFYERATDPFSNEAIQFETLRNRFVGFSLEIAKKKKSTASNKNLKYKNMEKYISVFENRDELMEMFNLAKSLSLVQPNPYNFVKGWFKEQFPNYKEMPKVSKDGKLYAFPIVPKAEETEKAEELKRAYNF